MASFPPPTSTSGGPGPEDAGLGAKGKGLMPADEVERLERGRHEIRTREVTQKDRVLAASCGAVVTSLTMTPFDVVKTRLQTQATPSHPILFSPSASTAASTSSTCCQKTYFNTNAASENLLCRFDPRQTTSFLPATGSHRPFSRVAIASLLPSSGGAVEALVHPHGSAAAACVFPDARVAAQTLSDSPHDALANRPARGLFDALVLIVRREGLSALWRGVSPALAMSVPSQAVYMVGYDTLRRSLYTHAPSPFTSPASSKRPNPTGEGLDPRYRDLVAPLTAGAVSRTLVAVAFSPLELFRTRLQASSDLRSTSAIVRATWFGVRSEGVVTLWRGLPATLWRDVPFSAVYWAGYETTRRFLTGGKGMGERDVGHRSHTPSSAVDEELEVARAKVRTMAKSFVAGSVSGCAAAIVTNPFDVVKTRRQAGTMDGAAEGTIATLTRIAREEGRPALMKGLTPRLAKIVPACGIMIASYEGLAQVLAEWC